MVFSNNLDVIVEVKQVLHDLFKIKDLGEARYFLGMEITKGDQGLVLTQRKYALGLLKDTGFTSSKPAATPMETSVRLSHGDLVLLDDNQAYRNIVGKLMYLTITRPDICFAVQQLSQFLDSPTEFHL